MAALLCGEERASSRGEGRLYDDERSFDAGQQTAFLVLFLVGDRAHSKFFSENVYAAAREPKELYVVKDAEHIDLYDRTDRIPFDKLENFFKKNL